MAQTDQDIKDYVSRRLGSGVVGVELTDDQLVDAITDSKMFFQTYIGQQKVHKLSGISSGGEYDMPADCDSVVDVAWDIRGSDLYDRFDWAGVELGPLNYGMYGGYRSDGSIGGGYSYLIQAINYRDQAKRVLGLDRDWIWDHAKQKIVLFPSGSEGRGIGTDAEVRYLVKEVDLSLLRPYEYNLLRKYSLGEAMEILGFIRTKYNDLPSASGNISLNGDNLLSKSEEIKMDVLEKLKTLRPPAPFFAG